jgi:hypothetical protein
MKFNARICAKALFLPMLVFTTGATTPVVAATQPAVIPAEKPVIVESIYDEDTYFEPIPSRQARVAMRRCISRIFSVSRDALCQRKKREVANAIGYHRSWLHLSLHR